MTDDEHEIAVVVPKKRRQHCGALGSAVVSHFSYCEFLDLEIFGLPCCGSPFGYAMAAAVLARACWIAALYDGCGPCCGVAVQSV